MGVWNGVPAGAQDAPELARAVALFERSEDLYNDGEFREAARLLIEAYEIHPDPILQFNLGRALESAGDLDAAIEAYARYLEEAPDAEDRGAIEQRLRTLRAQRDRLAASGDPDDDGAPILDTTERSDGEGGGSVLPWILGGAGLAVVGAGVALGLMSQSKHDDATAARTQTEAHALQSDAETFATIANVSFVVGGLLVGAGVLSFVLSSGDDEDESATIGIGPGGVLVRGAF